MSESLISSKKDELDRNNASSRPKILEKKCRRCGEMHPIVTFYWKKSNQHDGVPSVKIEIPCADQEMLQKVFKAERALAAIGIHFDTGYGGVRDWEFDWSLSGEHWLFDEEKGEYIKTERGSN